MDNVDMLVEPIRASLHQIGAFLPRLLLAIVVLIVGWLRREGWCASPSSRRCARSTSTCVTEKRRHRRLPAAGRHADIDTIRVLGGLFYWLVILAALMIAFNTLGLAYVTDLLGRVVLFVPRVMVARRDPRVRRLFRALHRDGAHDLPAQHRRARGGAASAGSRSTRSWRSSC